MEYTFRDDALVCGDETYEVDDLRNPTYLDPVEVDKEVARFRWSTFQHLKSFSHSSLLGLLKTQKNKKRMKPWDVLHITNTY